MKKFMNYFPMMEPAEVALIEKYLKPDDVMLEWGSGNSTLYFSQFVKKLVSVEHDLYWHDEVGRMIRKEGVENVYRYFLPKGHFDYCSFAVNTHNHFTKVLIDGRNRVRCAKGLLHVIDETALVFLHDWQREYYKPVLAWYDVAEEITDFPGMVVLRKKAGL
jgi:hypothetical protein